MQLIKRFKTILTLAGGHKKKLFIASFFSVLAGLTGLLPFLVIANLGEDLALNQISDITLQNTAFIICGLLLAKYVFLGIGKVLFHLVAYLTMYDLQIQLAEKIGKMPLGKINDEGSSKLKKVILQDTDITHTIIGHYIEDFLTGIAVPLMTLVAFFYVDWRMGLVAAAMLPLLYVAHRLSFRNFDQEAEAYFKANEEMQSSFAEYVSGIKAIKVFNRNLSERLINNTQTFVSQLVNWTKKTIIGWTAFNTVAESTLLLLLPAGLIMVMYNMMTPAAFLFFLLLGINFLQPFIRLSIQIGFLNYAGKSLERIESLLNEEELNMQKQPQELANSKIEIRNIDFYYNDKQVIYDLSLTVNKGEVCALVGPSGAGKSTLAQLIGRFWDVNKGSINIGGHNIKDLPEAQLYQQVAFVFQDVFLFSGTIADNLRLAKPDATDEELISACKAARAHEFIMRLPQRYQSPAGDRGAMLSGGQKQRISIARAILRDAPILILDEATAYADPINETEIQIALNNLMQGKTIIVIAHRLHTITHADKIVVLDKGRIQNQGKHWELMTKSPLYQSMWRDYQKAQKASIQTKYFDKEAA